MRPGCLLFGIVACIFASSPTLRCEEVQRIEHSGKAYTVVRVNLDEQTLELFWKNEAGQFYKSFAAIQDALNRKGRKLLFAMNAGMYHRDYSTVGVYVENGRQFAPVNLQSGSGNFFMLPNGVFAVTEKGALIVESSHYPQLREKVLLATQSGPMLLIDGKVHPAFKPESDSRLFRNGVGIVSPKEVVFAITEEPVNFYEFALLFRDGLHCGNALFFDGTVSSLYSEKLKRNDRKIDLGAMIGITAKQ